MAFQNFYQFRDEGMKELGAGPVLGLPQSFQGRGNFWAVGLGRPTLP